MPRAMLVGCALALALLSTSPAARAEELTFARALRLARQRAPEMKLAKARVASADAQVDLARTPYFPSLTGTGTGSYTALGESAAVLPPRTTPVSIVNYTTGASAGGTVRWTLFDFGRTANAVDAAEAGKDASLADAANTEARLVDTVAGGYLDVVYSEKVRDIQRSIVEDRERSIQIVKGLVKQGLAPAVEELRAQSRVFAARRELELADAQLAEALVDSARARYYPTLGFNGDASYRIAKLDVFDQWLPTRSATAALILSIPLFDASNRARLNVAKAEADRNQATYELARRDARTEAARTVVALSTSERVLDQAKKAAEASAAVLAVIRARYLQGLSNTLDLIEAETSDAEARIAAVRAERSVDGATVRLLVATGRSSRLLDVP